jgi:hypothetical protein
MKPQLVARGMPEPDGPGKAELVAISRGGGRRAPECKRHARVGWIARNEDITNRTPLFWLGPKMKWLGWFSKMKPQLVARGMPEPDGPGQAELVAISRGGYRRAKRRHCGSPRVV